MSTFDNNNPSNNSLASAASWKKYASISADTLFPNGKISRLIEVRGAGVLMLLLPDGTPAEPLEFAENETKGVQASGIVDSGTTATNIWVYF